MNISRPQLVWSTLGLEIDRLSANVVPVAQALAERRQHMTPTERYSARLADLGVGSTPRDLGIWYGDEERENRRAEGGRRRQQPQDEQDIVERTSTSSDTAVEDDIPRYLSRLSLVEELIDLLRNRGECQGSPPTAQTQPEAASVQGTHCSTTNTSATIPAPSNSTANMGESSGSHLITRPGGESLRHLPRSSAPRFSPPPLPPPSLQQAAVERTTRQCQCSCSKSTENTSCGCKCPINSDTTHAQPSPTPIERNPERGAHPIRPYNCTECISRHRLGTGPGEKHKCNTCQQRAPAEPPRKFCDGCGRDLQLVPHEMRRTTLEAERQFSIPEGIEELTGASETQNWVSEVEAELDHVSSNQDLHDHTSPGGASPNPTSNGQSWESAIPLNSRQSPTRELQGQPGSVSGVLPSTVEDRASIKDMDETVEHSTEEPRNTIEDDIVPENRIEHESRHSSTAPYTIQSGERMAWRVIDGRPVPVVVGVDGEEYPVLVAPLLRLRLGVVPGSTAIRAQRTSPATRFFQSISTTTMSALQYRAEEERIQQALRYISTKSDVKYSEIAQLYRVNY
ncbi:hypothetical protein P154DRAFT_571330 [Amniculicola lignicola CBS 123094]|uniref:Uncharacterized protein n=1 Tax=Amniculicola lignicola CBS 123094 TaxID=1392246 RepID=A0A6A5X0Z8_9PLEO|nr:hypothetical protein P154DRAFT_571330 [Amniculicola lignicola CBS 123094]